MVRVKKVQAIVPFLIFVSKDEAETIVRSSVRQTKLSFSRAQILAFATSHYSLAPILKKVEEGENRCLETTK
jgi:mannose/fructose/N-acetylgalactosamine-specific phosphotransferase system component IID